MISMRSIESSGMVERSTCAMSTSLSRRPLSRNSVLAVAKAPKPRRSTEVLAPFTPPNKDCNCTPGTCAMISARVCEGECAISLAVMTVEDVPTMPLNCGAPPAADDDVPEDETFEPLDGAGLALVAGATSGAARRGPALSS